MPLKELPRSDREYREKKRNENAKLMAKTITQNLYTYLCVAIPFLLIATIWTDFTMPNIGWGLAGDGVLTVALMVVGERLMVKIGAFGGKLDDEYDAAVKRCMLSRQEVKKRNTALLIPFCEWQIDQEFERARRARCSRIRIKYDDYIAKYEGKTFAELKTMLPLDKLEDVYQINRLNPIELTPDMLLYDCGRGNSRREIPESGEEYENRKVYGKKGILISVVTCVFCVGMPLTWSGAITLSRVIYTLGKLMILLYRMFKGYGDGARAYHTIEVRHLNVISDYLDEFVDFVDNQKYLSIANEYTDINRIMGIESPRSGDDNVKIPCVQPNQERAGDGDLGSQPNRPTDADRACA